MPISNNRTALSLTPILQDSNFTFSTLLTSRGFNTEKHFQPGDGHSSLLLHSPNKSGHLNGQRRHRPWPSWERLREAMPTEALHESWPPEGFRNIIQTGHKDAKFLKSLRPLRVGHGIFRTPPGQVASLGHRKSVTTHILRDAHRSSPAACQLRVSAPADSSHGWPSSYTGLRLNAPSSKCPSTVNLW